MKHRDRLIVALDVVEFEKAKKLVDLLYPTVSTFKIGSILFTSCGSEIMKAIHMKGAKAFLDLKFHDIPHTVSKAVESATRLGIFMLSVHTLGGKDMMEAAVEAAGRCAGHLNIAKPKILGVTILTSMNAKDLKGVGISRDLKEQVIYLAKLAKGCGLDGIIASAQEIAVVREVVGKGLDIVTPGIRPADSVKAALSSEAAACSGSAYRAKEDQKRITTPADAIKNGADYIVVGRPIIEAPDPKAVAEKILSEIKESS